MSLENSLSFFDRAGVYFQADHPLAETVAEDIANEYPGSDPVVTPISTPDPGGEVIVIQSTDPPGLVIITPP